MIIDHLYLLDQIGVQPGQHRWVQIKLCQIGFPSLLVGLVCFEQEVRIDSPSTPQVHIITIHVVCPLLVSCPTR